MTKYFDDFESDLDKMIYKQDDSEHTLQLNYAYLISCMETYLSKTMWGTLDEYPEKYNDLGKGINRSAKLKKIFSMGIPNFIKQALETLQYHNLAQVKIHYKNAFKVNFQKDLSDLLKAVNIRHDIVHRCGASKDNKKIHINFNDICTLKKKHNNLCKKH